VATFAALSIAAVMSVFVRRVNRSLLSANTGARNGSSDKQSQGKCRGRTPRRDKQPDANQIDLSLIDEYAYCE
jgi:hypothetical protein